MQKMADAEKLPENMSDAEILSAVEALHFSCRGCKALKIRCWIHADADPAKGAHYLAQLSGSRAVFYNAQCDYFRQPIHEPPDLMVCTAYNTGAED